MVGLARGTVERLGATFERVEQPCRARATPAHPDLLGHANRGEVFRVDPRDDAPKTDAQPVIGDGAGGLVA